MTLTFSIVIVLHDSAGPLPALLRLARGGSRPRRS